MSLFAPPGEKTYKEINYYRPAKDLNIRIKSRLPQEGG
jgi:hypothetical protein